MSQDLISDCLNQIMNAKKSGKSELVVNRVSKLLIEVLEIAKKNDYLDFSHDKKQIRIKIKDLSECRTIKPRYFVKIESIDKYARRFLPARNVGLMIISTNEGLMTHEQAYEKKIGGSLIAYFV